MAVRHRSLPRLCSFSPSFPLLLLLVSVLQSTEQYFQPDSSNEWSHQYLCSLISTFIVAVYGSVDVCVCLNNRWASVGSKVCVCPSPVGPHRTHKACRTNRLISPPHTQAHTYWVASYATFIYDAAYICWYIVKFMFLLLHLSSFVHLKL